MTLYRRIKADRYLAETLAVYLAGLSVAVVMIARLLGAYDL